MNGAFSSRFACLVVLAVIGLVPGCGKKLPPMTPVSGKVTVDGKPLTGGQVTLLPDSGAPNQPSQESAKGGAGEAQTGLWSVGQISSDGTYKVYTSGKEGAPLGKYKVTVTPSMMPSPDAKSPPAMGFSRKYGDSKSTPLNFEVVANPEPGKYDLKLNK